MISIKNTDNNNIQEQQHEIGSFSINWIEPIKINFLLKRMINNKTEHTKVQHLECVGSYIVN